MRSFHRQNQQGFGIIEVIVGIAIMGILIAVTLTAFSHGVAVSGSIRRKIKAMHIASGNLDRTVQILFQDFNKWSDATITSPGADGFECPSPFTMNIKISTVKVLGRDDYKKIVSTIYWVENGDTKSVSFTSSLYNIQKDIS